MVIEDNYFKQNDGSEFSGALSITNLDVQVFSNNTFLNNTAGYGGAVTLFSTETNINDSNIFKHN